MDLAKSDELSVLQGLTHPGGDPIAESSLVLLVQARPAAEGELAVDLLKDVEILAPPGLDRGRCNQGRDALQLCPGGIIGRVVRAYEVDLLAEVRDRPFPEPGMRHIASNQMTGMAFIEPSGNTLACRARGSATRSISRAAGSAAR
ncbi:hypothetical protein WMF04_18815 [Sorangium sp. So ce260]|uniref:hypothetical protein n=1 Tax=Sorangium sp. So ce260 TaxID=3133291 RepID=UPI003F635CFF